MLGEGEDRGTERFECLEGCGSGPYFKEDGLLMDPNQRGEYHRREDARLGAACAGAATPKIIRHAAIDVMATISSGRRRG
ncbi:hypothetical protein B2J88_44495 [Rhodococcus sp. SRB_17]|nr:hypothetical protein [Rhodococcus sp. SRB_17]